MNKEDLQAALEAIGKGGITIAGDFVVEKHVEHEVANVEAGGIGIQIVNGNTPKAAPLVKGKDEPPKMEGILASEDAMKYWRRLKESGFVDDDCQLLPETTRKQAMYIAEAFAEKLRMNSKWKLFELLWGIKNLAQEKWDFQQTGTMPTRYQEIDRIFGD